MNTRHQPLADEDKDHKEPSFEEMLQSYPFDHQEKFAGADQESAAPPPRKKKPEEPWSLDLHGMTVAEAESYLKAEIDALLHKYKQITLKIITGRGRHSEYGPILADAAHLYVRQQYGRYIQRIDSSPATSTINRIAVRGHFMVVLSQSKS